MRQVARTINLIIKETIKQDDLQVLIDDLKDTLSRIWDEQKRKAIIEAIRDLERFQGPVSWDEFER